MLNKIIRFSVANRVGVLAASAIIMIVGVIAILKSDVDIFPDLNAPTVSVMTEAPGFTAEEIENSVTFPIETSLNGASSVRRITSSSLAGFSVVKVEFDWGTDDFEARQIVSEKLSTVAEALPAGAGQPVLGPQSSILGEIMLIGIESATISPIELRDKAERILAPRLRSIPGVAQVSVMGSTEKQFVVTLSPEKMATLGLSLESCVEALRDINQNLAGGYITDYGQSYSVKANLNSTDFEEIRNTAVGESPDGTIIRLRDVATIEIGNTSPRLGAAAVSGNDAILLTIVKQRGASTGVLTKEADRIIKDFTEANHDQIKANTELFRQDDFISASVSNLQISLIEGSIFVVIVLFIFLMNYRTTIISITALPVSVITTLLILNLMGITINTMTLGGIAIAIGSLVDDAIVDVENVYRRIRENSLLPLGNRLPIKKVVGNASAEVRLPILNSSLIIAASFLPLFCLSGIEGRMLMPLGIAFIVALASSTIVALTLTPALCVYLLKPGNKANNMNVPKLTQWINARYSIALQNAVSHKKIILWCTGGLLVVSLALLFTFGRNFLPPFNEGSLTINITAPAGTTLAESEKIGQIAESLILSNKEVRSTARKTGRAELDEHSRGINASEIEIAFHPTVSSRRRKELTNIIRHQLASLPGCVIETGQPISHRLNAMLSGSESQIAVKIKGNNLAELNRIGNQVKTIMGQTKGLVDISLPPVTESPRLSIEPNREAMAANGVNPTAFSTFFNGALNGIKVGSVTNNGFNYPIVAQYGNIHSSDAQIDYLSNLRIDTRNGKIPFGQLAEIRSTLAPDAIYRENISRQIVVGCNVDGRDMRGAVEELQGKISQGINLPADCTIEYGGLFESEARSSRTLMLASLGALLIILFILYNEYRNFTLTAIIMVNIPLAMIGGVLMLWLCSAQLNIPAIIGFISLMGISVRNGMLLISRYNKLKADGYDLSKRIITGSVERILPIIMTALTSALALVPLALRGAEPGNEIQSPMAIVILGGLLTSTILNIFVVPILYQLSQRNKTLENE